MPYRVLKLFAARERDRSVEPWVVDRGADSRGSQEPITRAADHEVTLVDAISHSVSRAGRLAILALRGQLTGSTGRGLRDVFEDLSRRGPAEVLVDLAGVSFMDGRGLRILLEAGQRCAERGVAFAVGSPSALVQKLFDVTGTFPRAGTGAIAGGSVGRPKGSNDEPQAAGDGGPSRASP